MYFLSIFIIPKISGKPSQHQKQICTSVSKILHPSGSESVSKFISQYLLALKTDERLIFVHKTDNFPHSESFSKLNLWARCIFDIVRLSVHKPVDIWIKGFKGCYEQIGVCFQLLFWGVEKLCFRRERTWGNKTLFYLLCNRVGYIGLISSHVKWCMQIKSNQNNEEGREKCCPSLQQSAYSVYTNSKVWLKQAYDSSVLLSDMTPICHLFHVGRTGCPGRAPVKSLGQCMNAKFCLHTCHC